MKEPAPSKELQIPPQHLQHQKTRQQMVDLTIEEGEEDIAHASKEMAPRSQAAQMQTRSHLHPPQCQTQRASPTLFSAARTTRQT